MSDDATRQQKDYQERMESLYCQRFPWWNTPVSQDAGLDNQK